MTRIFRFNPKARLKEVEEAARALRERPEVLAVVLFGSLAQGQATAASDADLFLLLSESPYPFQDRLVLYRPFGLRRIEVFPYTLEEARRSLKGRSVPCWHRSRTTWSRRRQFGAGVTPAPTHCRQPPADAQR